MRAITYPTSEGLEGVTSKPAELAEVTAERDDYAATVDEFIKDHKRWGWGSSRHNTSTLRRY
jgi:hypothetical protein